RGRDQPLNSNSRYRELRKCSYCQDITFQKSKMFQKRFRVPSLKLQVPKQSESCSFSRCNPNLELETWNHHYRHDNVARPAGAAIASKLSSRVTSCKPRSAASSDRRLV